MVSKNKAKHELGALSALVHRLADRKVLQEIEEAFGIDADFPEGRCFELIGCIHSKLMSLKFSGLNYVRQDSWFLIIDKVHKNLDDKNNKTRKIAINNFRAEGKSKSEAIAAVDLEPSLHDFNPLRYPIPAFFMEKGLSEDKERFGVSGYYDHAEIRALFLIAIMNRSGELDFNNLAIVLRESLIGPCASYSKFLSSLDPVGSISSLLDSKESIVNQLAEDHPRTDPFVMALRKLCEIVRPCSEETEKNSPKTVSTRPSVLDNYLGHDGLSTGSTPGVTAAAPPEHTDQHAKTALASSEFSSEDVVEGQPRENRENRHWEARFQRITPNDYTRLTSVERRRVVHVLSESLQSEDRLEVDCAAVVFLMYVTGMRFGDLLAAKVGEQGDFSADGWYRRNLRLPVDAYEPPSELVDDFETYQPRIALQLPQMIVPWMNARLGPGHDTLVGCLGGDTKQLRQGIESVFDRMRDSGRYPRIRSELIPAALAVELALRHQDPSVIFHLSGRPNHVAPMLSYYVVHSVDVLAERYSNAVHALLGLPFRCRPNASVTRSYSGHYPSEEAIRRFRQGVSDQVRLPTGRKIDLISRHNAFTSYCLGLLLLSTGHRPVRDPFCSPRHFDLDRGVLLICDKATDQTRAWRLVALPEIAVSQMKEYLDYLPTLAARLKQEHPGSTLPQRILRMSQGEPGMLPLFFLLNAERGCKHVSIKESVLGEQWSGFWSLPVNFLRHIMATRLLQRTNRADYVQLQLGHMTGTDYPLGQKSTEPVLKTLSEIACSLDNILREDGWVVMTHRMRLSSPGVSINRAKKLEPIRLGPELRQADWELKQAQAGDLIRKLLAERPLRVGSIRQEELEELLQRVESEAVDRGYSASRCRRMLYQYVRRQRGGKALLRQVASIQQVEREPSPFTEGTLDSYRALAELRNGFVSHLDQRGRAGSKPSMAERLVEIICSAALFGGMASSDRLQGLGHALQTSTYRYRDQLFVDIPLSDEAKTGSVTRWFPDKISRSLIEGLYKARKSGATVKISERPLQNLLSSIGGGGQKPFDRLAEMSKTGLLLECPGYLAAAATADIPAVSLPLAAWVRVVSGAALEGRDEACGASVPQDKVGWLPDLVGSANSCSQDESRAFLRQLKGLISRAKDAQRTASKGVALQQKRALTELLKEAVERSPAWPVLHKMLVSWAVHLCQHGTPYKSDLAYATVDKYVMLVANRLCPASIKVGDFLALESEGFERLYLSMVLTELKERRFELARQLYAFHNFIVDNFCMESLDWSAVMAAAGGTIPIAYADANYITGPEYQKALQAVLQDKNLPAGQALQYAGLLMWGYRFGLRFGEAFRLQYRDVQRESGELYLWIRNTLHGEVKTDASKRVACLLTQLSSSEAELIDKLLSSGKSDFEEDQLIPLMRYSAGSRELTNRYQVAQYLGRLLKTVTGDKSVRFHHLRHGWVTRQVGALAEIDVPGFSGEIPSSCARQEHKREGGYPLRSISIGVGHASEITTLKSYTHCLDQIVPKYRPDLSAFVSDFAVAYAEQVSADTPRRRRSRGKSHGWLAPVPSPEVKISNRLQVPPRTESCQHKPLRLPEFDRLLRRFSVSGQLIEAVAVQLEMDAVIAQKIVRRATRVEILGGYRGYRLAERSDDPVTRAACATAGAEKLNHTENQRMPILLSQLATRLDSMQLNEQRAFFAGVETWLQATNRASDVCIVADVEELSALMSMVGTLEATAEILVEQGYDVELLKEMKAPVTIMPKLLMKKVGGVPGRVVVKLRSSQKIGPQRSLRRLLFLLATAAPFMFTPAFSEH